MRNLSRLLGVLTLTLFAGTPLAAQDPYEQPDDSWISLTGTVESVTANSFVLNYNRTSTQDGGWITVEMDDGDRDADAYKLMRGDTVTVNGLIDDDFFEARTIEASSVYVANLDTYFFASAMDEEDRYRETYLFVPDPLAVGYTLVQGTVTEVSDEEFKLNTGVREVTVEVDEMSYNPLDEEGYQKIEVGDRVSVAGEVDYDFLEGREFVASSVVTLKNGS